MVLGFGTDKSDNPQKTDLIKDTTTKDFVEDVIKASADIHIVVDFWSPRCGPCKQLTPILEKYVEQAAGTLKLVKMNVDEHPAIFSQLAMQLGTQSIPAIIVFKNGAPVDGFMGALPESQVKDFLAKFAGDALDDNIEAVLETAELALQDEDYETAGEVFKAVLAEDEHNLKAIAGLAKCLIKTDNIDQAKAILADVPADKHESAEISAVMTMLDLIEQSSSIGDISDLENQLQQDPANHQARLDLALALNANDQREAAMEALFNILKKDRNWNEEAAKKQLVQFFEAWGPTDPHTKEGRKRLSIILFS